VAPRNPSPARRWLLLLAAWVLTLALPLAVPAEPQGEGTDLQALMQLLAQRKHGHVTYVEEHFIGTLDRPLTSSGELLYEAPDRFEKRTLRPKPETLIVEHGIITVHRGRHTIVLDLASYPQIVPLIDSIRATLAGDLPSLEQRFAVVLQGNLDGWRLSLTPHEVSVTQTVKQIEIQGSRGDLKTVEIRQADGDRSRLTLGAELP